MQAKTLSLLLLLVLVLARGFRPPTPPKGCRRSPPKREAASSSSQAIYSSASTTIKEPLTEKDTTESRDAFSESSSYLQPPPYLADLDIGAAIEIDDRSDDSPPMKIIKLSNDPPLFWVQNFLSRHDCETLIESASTTLKDAETRQGIVEHRVGSKVAWLGDITDEEEDEHGGEDNLPANVLAGYTQHLAAHLFLPHAPQVQAERLQVVQYEPQGKYDIHHDGFNRTVTVLTYLNGVAGTWFPYAGAESSDDADIPQQSQLVSWNVLNHKQPGRDGICMTSRRNENVNVNDDLRKDDDRTNGNHSHKKVQVRPGDAIVFYNYQEHDEHGTILSWKSLHCGLRAKTTEKWIATNWLRAYQDDDDEDNENYRY